MERNYISDPGAIGAVMISSLDDGVIYMYSSAAGKMFKKSFDNGRTFSEEWIVRLGSITANANLLRLSNDDLVMTLKYPT